MSGFMIPFLGGVGGAVEADWAVVGRQVLADASSSNRPLVAPSLANVEDEEEEEGGVE